MDTYDGTDGRPRYYPASPGAGGALKDFIESLSRALAPKSITQRHGAINMAVDKQTGDEPKALGDEF